MHVLQLDIVEHRLTLSSRFYLLKTDKNKKLKKSLQA
jgi:hypothetical protein